MTRIAALVALALTALVALPVTAQAPSPAHDGAVDTYCLEVTVPTGTEVTAEGMADLIYYDEGTIVSVTQCGDASETDLGDLIPAGEVAAVDVWKVTVTDVNGDGWNVAHKENMFNDRPPRDSRIVIISVKVGHDDPGNAYDPAFELDWNLFDENGDGFDEYDGVMPKEEYDVGSIPSGRSKTFNLVYVVPNDIPLKNLVLYVEAGDEYNELAVTR